MTDFYQKYKQLFEVSDAPIPQTRLTINHQLFIDKPYQPAYKEELKLSSKLMEMRKGYDQLQSKIDQIMNSLTPKKPLKYDTPSLATKDVIREIPQFQQPIIQPRRPVSTKLSNIFNSEKDHIVKESQMQHVFGYRLKNSKVIPKQEVKVKSPILQTQTNKQNRFPKLQPLKRMESYPVKNNIFAQQEDQNYHQQTIRKNPNIANHGSDGSYKLAKPLRLPYKEVLNHRKEANRKIQQRRQRLRSMLRIN